MGPRRFFFALFLLLPPPLALRATAAPEPSLDGRDCHSFEWIRPDACAAFQSYNAAHSDRWWAKWNDSTGYQRVLFRNRGDRVPGIDFKVIAENDVRSDAATRALVEAYARMRLRAFLDEFGFRHDLQDLIFADFRKNPGRPFSQAVEDSSDGFTEALHEMPATITIRLQQVAFRGANIIPIDRAGVTLVVTDENDLLSIVSQYLPDADLQPGPEIDAEDAIESALLYLGVELTEIDDGPFAWSQAIQIENQELRRVWRVAFESDVPVTAGNWEVDVDAATGAVLAAADQSAESHTPFTRIANGFIYDQDALDALSGCNPTPPPLGPGHNCYDDYADALRDERLFLLDEDRTDLHGRFARVNNADIGNARPNEFGRYDFQSVVGAVDCQYDPAAALAIDPHFPQEETFVTCLAIGTREEESHHDEVLVYHYVTSYAFGLASQYDGWTLSRGSGVPGIPVRVNHSSEWPNAKFVPGCSSGFLGLGGGCSPKIKIGDGDRWKWIANDHALGSGFPPIDFLVQRDNGKEADVPIHEYGHAVLWDKGIGFSGRFTKAVHEGHADFLAADALDQSVHGEWTRNSARDLDPATDRAYPQNLDQSSPISPHTDGQIWSGALWDLRKRGREIVAAGLAAGIGAPVVAADVSALSFYFADYAPGSFDFPCADCGFQPALVSLLTTDHARFDGRYTYEILAANARHGIQVEEPIAVISPETLVTDATTSNPDLAFRVYLGTNDQYAALFSPFPPVLRGEVSAVFNPDLPGFNALIAFGAVGGGLGGGPVEPLLPSSPVGTQNSARIELPGDLVRRLADLSPRNPAPIYARVFTFSESQPDDERDSYIPDAGEFIVNGDFPLALYATPDPAPGCGCRLGSESSPAGSFALCALLLMIVRRIRS